MSLSKQFATKALLKQFATNSYEAWLLESKDGRLKILPSVLVVYSRFTAVYGVSTALFHVGSTALFHAGSKFAFHAGSTASFYGHSLSTFSRFFLINQNYYGSSHKSSLLRHYNTGSSGNGTSETTTKAKAKKIILLASQFCHSILKGIIMLDLKIIYFFGITRFGNSMYAIIFLFVFTTRHKVETFGYIGSIFWISSLFLVFYAFTTAFFFVIFMKGKWTKTLLTRFVDYEVIVDHIGNHPGVKALKAMITPIFTIVIADKGVDLVQSHQNHMDVNHYVDTINRAGGKPDPQVIAEFYKRKDGLLPVAERLILKVLGKPSK